MITDSTTEHSMNTKIAKDGRIDLSRFDMNEDGTYWAVPHNAPGSYRIKKLRAENPRLTFAASGSGWCAVGSQEAENA